MNYFNVLEDKIRFLQRFYALTTAPFIEIKYKIEANEEPYVFRGEPDDCDEPPYLTEWQDADEGYKLQQQLCLSLLQRSFREFLDAVVRKCGGNPKKSGDGWFADYLLWLTQTFGFDWKTAPVSLDRIEELTLARNCIQHGGEGHRGASDVLDPQSLLKRQSLAYHVRFPDAFFASDFEKSVWKEQNYPQPVSIELTPTKLEVATEDILNFCKFIYDVVG